jgi:hypothetical protein
MKMNIILLSDWNIKILMWTINCRIITYAHWLKKIVLMKWISLKNYWKYRIISLTITKKRAFFKQTRKTLQSCLIKKNWQPLRVTPISDDWNKQLKLRWLMIILVYLEMDDHAESLWIESVFGIMKMSKKGKSQINRMMTICWIV